MTETAPEVVTEEVLDLDKGVEEVRVAYQEVKEQLRKVKLAEDDLRNERTLLDDAEARMYQAREYVIRCAVVTEPTGSL